MRNSRLVGGRCHSLPDPYGCDSDVRARLYKQIAGYCVISGWRRSTWNRFDLPHARVSFLIHENSSEEASWAVWALDSQVTVWKFSTVALISGNSLLYSQSILAQRPDAAAMAHLLARDGDDMGLRFDLGMANWVAFVTDERLQVPDFSSPMI